MDRIFKLPVGVALFAFLTLAGLMGIFASNAVPPVGAQNVVAHTNEVEEHSTDEVRLGAYEPDRTQIADRWELVTDTDDPAYDDDFLDYRHFKIDRMSGVLTFKTPPDYEDPRSSAAATADTLEDKNVYKVKAKFGDGEKYLAVEVTVQVTGIEEDGTITLSNRRPQAGVGLMALLEDPDKGIRTPDWQWQVETDEGTGVFEDIANAVNRTYTPQAGDVGKYLKATATYQDGHGTDYVEEEATSEFVVRAAPGSNDDPEFQENDEEGDLADGVQTSRRIEENSAPGTKVGPAVKATDDDHLPAADPGGEPRDELTYSLRDPDGATGTDNTDGNDDDNDINTPSDGDGHAALFSIDQATGQITTKYPLLDRESLSGNTPPYAYSVVVRATDPSGAFEDMELDIYVLDVEETPELTGPAALTYLENSASLLLDRDLDDTAEEVQEALYRATDNDLDDGLDDGSDPSGDDTQIQWELTGPDASRFQFALDADTNPIRTYTDSDAISDADSTATPPTVAVATAPALQFRSAPNVEAPADVGGIRAGDNIYEITVRAWDEDWLIGSRDVTIRVADTDDAGTVTLSHIQPQQGTEITATLNDPDGISGQVSWQWYTGGLGGDGEPTGTAITGATSASYTPTTETGDLSVKATYEDRGSRGQERTATATTENDARTNPVADDGENTAPKFYVDTVDGTAIDLTDTAQRISANETTSYTRYVLEGQTRSVRLSEIAAREYVDTDDAAAAVKVFDGHFTNAQAVMDETFSPDGDGDENLQYDLSGADAKYFEISLVDVPAQPNANPPVLAETRGGIRTKKALDFETKSVYTVTFTATDPSGEDTSVTVTIHALDQAEIEGIPGDQKRVWVNEGVESIDSLEAANPPAENLGGLKWSLLTTNEAQTTPEHNRNSALSVDCQADTTNDRLCDDFRFSRFHTTTTNLLFAIGEGEQHDVPNFEDPQDVEGEEGTSALGTEDQDATDQAEMDNVYQVVVRVAFATLRSDGDANHPNPQSDEMDERTYLVRVVDVDEAPSFRGADSDQSIDENSDDDLPTIEINRDVGGSVTATDPEDTSTPDPDKKLTFTLDLPADYANMFHIVPSTGEILTGSRIDYEALDLEEQGTPGGQYKTISGVTITVADSFNPEAYSDTRFEPVAQTATIDVSINVRDVNETPVPAMALSIAGDAASDYAEMQDDTTVGTYMVSGDNVATATLSLATGDPDGADGPLTAAQNADVALFDLDVTGREGTLKFKAAPDFEMPADADMDNMYMVTLQVRHDDEDMAYMPVTITVTDVDELGMLTADMDSPISYMENDTMTVATYTLTGGTMDDTAMWTTMGADADYFTIMDGMLKFKMAPDYEMPRGMAMSDDNMNTYMVTVKAEAGSEMDMQAVEVMVTDVDELGMLTADMDSPISYMENDTMTVATYTLTGGTMDDTAMWTTMGADADYFTIMDGMLKFKMSPDYEMPRGMAMSDDNMNTYMVTVKAEAGSEMDMQAVEVMVTNAEEDETVTLSMSHPVVGTALTAELMDSDVVTAGTVTWQWSRSMTMDGTFMDINGATSMTYRPVAADDGHYLKAKAMYTDGYGPDMAEQMTANPVTTTPDQPGMVTLSTAPVVDTPVTATLTDDDVVTQNTLTWDWWISGTMNGTYEAIAGAETAMYTPTADDATKYIKARASYTDGHGSGKTAASAAVMVTEVPVVDPLLTRYDTDPQNGRIDRSEVLTAINDYISGQGANPPTRTEVLRLINLYISGN